MIYGETSQKRLPRSQGCFLANESIQKLMLRSDNTLLWEEKYLPSRIPIPKYSQSDCSLVIKLLLNLSSGKLVIYSGIISVDSSRPRQPKVKFCQSTRYMRSGLISSRLTAFFWSINPELTIITCTRNTEMCPWMGLSVSFIWKWLETTEHLRIPSQLSEHLSSTKRKILEEQRVACSEIADWNSLSYDQLLELVTKDSEQYSKRIGLTPSNNDE